VKPRHRKGGRAVADARLDYPATDKGKRTCGACGPFVDSGPPIVVRGDERGGEEGAGEARRRYRRKELDRPRSCVQPGVVRDKRAGTVKGCWLDTSAGE
jgi:hypothetical protein